MAPIISRTKDGILFLTLDQPEKRNALSNQMMAALQDALDTAGEDRAVRVIVLAGTGSVFCAGHDLKEMNAARAHKDGGRGFYDELMNNCARLMQTIVNHPCPVIADIRGIATAAGCQLVASCDLAIAGANAQFCTPGVHLGLFCSTPMVALSRNVSRKHAMEMLLTGEMIDARRAEQLGLVNKVVAENQMDDAVISMAATIASKSTMTVQTGKTAFYRQVEMDLPDAYEYASKVMVENMMKQDAKEGIGSFLGKRDAKWSDS